MPLNPFKKSPLDAAHSTRTKQAELLEEAKLALADRIATVDQLGDGCADAETLRKAISAKTAAQQHLSDEDQWRILHAMSDADVARLFGSCES
jgi:hypothetical protein